MKTEFLESLGIEKEVSDKILAEYGKSVKKIQTQVTNLTGERDTFKTQLDEISAKLKAFDGVDVAALKGEIDTLKGDIAQKETEFQTQLADRDFSASVNAAILTAKGKNPKAIMPLLDIDTLKTSKNQKEDIATALTALQESDAYLFEASDAEPPKTPARVSTGGTHDVDGDNGSSSTTNTQMNDLLRGKTKGD